jgi:hypothetical protein
MSTGYSWIFESDQHFWVSLSLFHTIHYLGICQNTYDPICREIHELGAEHTVTVSLPALLLYRILRS